METPSAMASAPPSMGIEEELKCPICKELFTDPVTLDCGHNFCRYCVTHYCVTWEGHGPLECPLCKARIKKGNFRPNWQLANIVKKIKHPSFNLGKEDLCTKHKEKLNLFCKEDEKLVCVICDKSPEHQAHTVLLLEDAAEEHKAKFCSCLEVLRKERERILEYKARTGKESQDLLTQIDAEMTKTTAMINQLQQFLEGQKKLFLIQMEELQEEIATRREEHLARLGEELSSLESLIQQMEKKCQLSASELLQDFGSTLQRWENRETFENPVAFPPALKWKSWEICDMNLFLESVIKPFTGTLASGLRLQKANVTLDPDTAHPELILSEDRRSVRWGRSRQALPNNPEKIDSDAFVLGREGFTAGRHFWEVNVGSEEGWAVGVARKSVSRKGLIHFSPEDGVWAVGKWGGKYRILQYPSSCPLSLTAEPNRIKVTLNFAARRVAFFDADTGALLSMHSEASFSGETLLPFFSVFRGGCLTLSP